MPACCNALAATPRRVPAARASAAGRLPWAARLNAGGGGETRPAPAPASPPKTRSCALLHTFATSGAHGRSPEANARFKFHFNRTRLRAPDPPHAPASLPAASPTPRAAEGGHQCEGSVGGLCEVLAPRLQRAMAALPASASAPNLLAAADAVMTPQRSSLSLSIDVAGVQGGWPRHPGSIALPATGAGAAAVPAGRRGVGGRRRPPLRTRNMPPGDDAVTTAAPFPPPQRPPAPLPPRCPRWPAAPPCTPPP